MIMAIIFENGTRNKIGSSQEVAANVTAEIIT